MCFIYWFISTYFVGLCSIKKRYSLTNWVIPFKISSDYIFFYILNKFFFFLSFSLFCSIYNRLNLVRKFNFFRSTSFTFFNFFHYISVGKNPSVAPALIAEASCCSFCTYCSNIFNSSLTLEIYDISFIISETL
nr:MAG TPA: hypothetical protein [Crassvirales sp.]